MAKQSQLDKILDKLRAERTAIDYAISKIEAQIAAKPAKATKRAKRGTSISTMPLQTNARETAS